MMRKIKNEIHSGETPWLMKMKLSRAQGPLVRRWIKARLEMWKYSTWMAWAEPGAAVTDHLQVTLCMYWYKGLGANPSGFCFWSVDANDR